MPKKRKKAKSDKYSDRLITGLGVAFISVAALLALSAFLINSEILDIDASKWIVIAVYIISSLICGAVATPSGKGNIIYYGLLPGVIFALMISLLSIIIDPNSFEFNEALRILLISAACSTTGSMLKLCKSNKKYHK